jgi:hypothetical protein
VSQNFAAGGARHWGHASGRAHATVNSGSAKMLENFFLRLRYKGRVPRVINVLYCISVISPLTMAVAGDAAALKAEVTELRSQLEQSESLFSQLERQFNEQQQEVSSVRAESQRLQQNSRALGALVFWVEANSARVEGSHYSKNLCCVRALLAEAQLESAKRDAAAANSRADEARAAAHRFELAARGAQEERDSAVASADLKQRDVDRLRGAP